MKYDKASRSADVPVPSSLGPEPTGSRQETPSITQGPFVDFVRSLHRGKMVAPDAAEREQEALMGVAKDIYLRRRTRSKFFSEKLFGEPAWDMLLALYITTEMGARQTVGQLVDFAAAPTTTAMRWLKGLEEEGYAERQANPIDGRVFFIRLTFKGREAIEAYLGALLDLGRPEK